jgi:hypothetical protein
VAEAQLIPHGMQAGLVHVEDILEGAVGDPLLTLEQRHHRHKDPLELPLGVGQRAGRGRPGGWHSRPDQDAPGFVDSQTLALDELVFERVQVRVIELKLELERAIGQAAPLAQQSNRLIYHGDKVHPVSSLSRALSMCTYATPS